MVQHWTDILYFYGIDSEPTAYSELASPALGQWHRSNRLLTVSAGHDPVYTEKYVTKGAYKIRTD
jgi:hypothetical protein